VSEALADPNGQLLFDFGDDPAEPAVEFTAKQLTADEWFALGCQHEEAGRLPEAEAAYRQALLAGGPDAVYCFNLANVLYALERRADASERYYQAVELDAQGPEAWNNLGTVLAGLSRFDEAKAAYLKAVQLGYSDAHYNLADMLSDTGEHDQARIHWQAYLQQDQHSAWARHARSRLTKIR